jgi:hypothetical protein
VPGVLDRLHNPTPQELQDQSEKMARLICSLIDKHPVILRMTDPDDMRLIGVRWADWTTPAQRRWALKRAKKMWREANAS